MINSCPVLKIQLCDKIKLYSQKSYLELALKREKDNKLVG